MNKNIIKIGIGYVGLYFIILYYLLFSHFDITIHDIFDINYIEMFGIIYSKESDDILKIMWLYTAIPFIAIISQLNKPHMKGNHGDAKFATSADTKEMGLNNDTNKALPLALFENKRLTTLEPLSCLILAPPGTGKSVAAIDMLLNTDQSFIVLDIKGELHEKTSRFREHYFKNEIMIFNPTRKESIKFNPLAKELLDGLDWDEISNKVKFISEILYQNKNESDYWTNEGKALFVGIALYLIQTYGYTSIPKIRSFLLSNWKKEITGYFEKLKTSQMNKQDENEKEIRQQIKIDLSITGDEDLAEIIKDVKDDDEVGIKTFIDKIILVNTNIRRQVQEAFSSLISKGDNELGSILGTCKSSLNAFDNDMILEKMDGNDLDIMRMRKEKISLYIVIGENEVKALAPIVKMFMEFSAISMMSEEPDKKKDNNTIIIFDEFPRFGKLDYIISLPALGRSYKIIVILIAQDFGQIKETYSQDKVDIILSTTAHKIVYKQMNTETAKKISEMIGNKTVEQTSVSESKSGKSTSHSLTGKPLVSAQDILSQDSDIIYLLEFGYYNRPIKCQPLRWYTDKRLLKMYDKLPKKEKVIIAEKPQAKKTDTSSSRDERERKIDDDREQNEAEYAKRLETEAKKYENVFKTNDKDTPYKFGKVPGEKELEQVKEIKECSLD